ncbi:UDP-4-amino-4,6-dideoxy-N-acetyl-beta-L-altrosamine transaminase [Compostibacillus humi]|uniref:UDP-4-amino-4,6-dideoxy-N-acetyl-beta-L-altrosamine transaminase n=1 Tax=Compostibacillus humi TaxID=1245525 RepID=A0A8J2TM18_9BACI|nr:UDP-4-amino-4,6-dideoxy-N-acetyl-beta-L-altrosamine transaminase [Compostibacillus humi]GFZ77927.1 UDP-4-amino-4,6-dideoxy-N-acetyl-beta-L-altrosamine transaminase [Compostibacillus humi]
MGPSKLALYGGKPVRDSYLPYGRQWVTDDDINSVIKVLKGDYLTTGPLVPKFEEAIAEYVGADYAVAFSSGTSALHAACFAAEIGKGDEVIVSPITFVASANCVLYQGATPVFADIDPKTYNIDPNQIESKITSKTKAIIPVDFTGQAVDMDNIKKIADRYGLHIIEDAAHALGSEYKGRKIGSLADMTEFSFHPVKPITAGEGGVITTDNEEFYKKLQLFRSHGITKNKKDFFDSDGPWYYEQQALGYNYRITDIQCALGLNQLNHISKFLYRRRKIADRYNQAFCGMQEVNIPFEAEYSNSGWHLYILRLNMNLLQADRKDIFEALQAENIGVNVHYIPVYYHPYYKKLGYKKGLCPNAEKLYEDMITLPLFPKMTDQDVEDVIAAVKKVIGYFRKQV